MTFIGQDGTVIFSLGFIELQKSKRGAPDGCNRMLARN